MDTKSVDYLLAIIGDKEVQIYTLRNEVAKLRAALDALTQDRKMTLKHLFLSASFALAFPATVAAQITPPNTFVGGTTILALKVNENFAKFGDALNRTGGTMTGALLFSTDNTLDIGAAGATRPRRVYIGTEVVSPLFTGGPFSGTTGTFSGAVSGASTS